MIQDVCGNVLVPVLQPNGGTYAGCEGTYTWEYLYTDCSGLTYLWVYTYNIDITTAPAEVGGPVSNSSTVECLADAVAPTTFPVIQDVCGNILVPVLQPNGGTYAGCEGTYTWEYLYTDCSGLTYTWVYTYNIDITTAPAEVGGPVSINGGTVECLADAVAPTTFPVIQDVCGNVLTPAAPTHGGTYAGCEGTYTWEYLYTDCSGLTYTWVYTYNIDITTPPAEVGGPVSTSGGTVECLADAVAPTTFPVIHDVCGNVLVPVLQPNGGTYAGCEGTYTWEYLYTDCSGLTYLWVYTYIIDITTAPVEVGGPVSTSGGTVECLADAVAPTTFPVIQDVCGNVLVPVLQPNGGTYAGCEGTYTWEYLYTDCSGLTYLWVYTYIIDITTPPSEVGGPVSNSSTVECLADAVAPTTFPVIQDVCGNVLVPVLQPNGGTYAGCEGTYTWEYLYTDCSGLTYLWVYTYNIDITTPPAELGGPVSINGGTVECLADAVAPTTFPVIQDVCGNVLVPVLQPNGGTYAGCEGTYTWEYLYTDCSGLTYLWVYTYNIDITTPPAEVGGPVSTSGGTVECLADAVAPTTFPVIQDVCGNVLIPAAPDSWRHLCWL